MLPVIPASHVACLPCVRPFTPVNRTVHAVLACDPGYSLYHVQTSVTKSKQASCVLLDQEVFVRIFTVCADSIAWAYFVSGALCHRGRLIVVLPTPTQREFCETRDILGKLKRAA